MADMAKRFQFTLRTLLFALLIVAVFFGGIQFERERRRRADEAAAIAKNKSQRALPITRMSADELDAVRRQRMPKQDARMPIHRSKVEQMPTLRSQAPTGELE